MSSTIAELYRRDLRAWAQLQAAALRLRAEGKLINDNALDWLNIAEEIEGLVRGEESKLSSMLGTIVEHLMKLQASPAMDPRRGWIDTVIRARIDIEELLEDSPSLGPTIPTALARATKYARRRALNSLRAHGETPTTDLNNLSYTAEQVLDDWFPPENGDLLQPP
jgi:hypothetical protein